MEVTEKILNDLKIVLREKEIPFFTDEELQFMVSNGNSFKSIAYRCLITKSENTTLSLSGLSLADTSSYFLRLARMYRENNGGNLDG